MHHTSDQPAQSKINNRLHPRPLSAPSYLTLFPSTLFSAAKSHLLSLFGRHAVAWPDCAWSRTALLRLPCRTFGLVVLSCCALVEAAQSAPAAQGILTVTSLGRHGENRCSYLNGCGPARIALGGEREYRATAGQKEQTMT